MKELATDIARYQAGEIEDRVEIIDLFQKLIDTGFAWHLDSLMQTVATDLIEQGYCTVPATYAK